MPQYVVLQVALKERLRIRNSVIPELGADHQ